MADNNIVIKDARILPGKFRNFSGEKREFNAEGLRNFNIQIPADMVEDLEVDGWNVRYLEPREEGGDIIPILKVAVSFDPYPPKVVLVSSASKTTMTEKTIGLLDTAEIEHVDLSISPYNWEVNGKTGVKAYLKTMYVKLIEDEFEADYSDIPYSGDSEA